MLLLALIGFNSVTLTLSVPPSLLREPTTAISASFASCRISIHLPWSRMYVLISLTWPNIFLLYMTFFACRRNHFAISELIKNTIINLLLTIYACNYSLKALGWRTTYTRYNKLKKQTQLLSPSYLGCWLRPALSFYLHLSVIPVNILRQLLCLNFS